MPVTKIPVGGYAAIAVSGNFANLRAAVLVELDKFIALIPNVDATIATVQGVSGAIPEYDTVDPFLARSYREELAALRARIAAAT
jgi:hypothetical protein